MQVSCKVSYSVVIFLERQGVQLEPFFEGSESPFELLRDPTAKLDAEEMELFLSQVGEYLGHKNSHEFFREVGQRNFELRAWGVLDSVLKMVESPRDIFIQPDRFLSYFLTPHPELDVEKPVDNKVNIRFKAPLEDSNILAYLKGAVEGLPSYSGKSLAQMERISATDFQITWNDVQESLFDEQEKKRRQFHPEIVQSVMESLKVPQQVSNSAASEAFEKMVAVEVEKRMEKWLSHQAGFDESMFKIKNDFYKMYDYFTRAQQIITLISPSARKASVKEAMRRVDWDYVQKEFPNRVESACDSILALKDLFHLEESNANEQPDAPNVEDSEENSSRPQMILQGGPHAENRTTTRP